MNDHLIGNAELNSYLVVEVEGDNPPLASALLESDEVSYFTWLKGPSGSRIRIECSPQTRSLTQPEGWMRVLFDLHGVGIPAALGLAQWLVRKLKERPGPKGPITHIVIDRTTIELTEEGILRVIEERIERTERKE